MTKLEYPCRYTCTKKFGPYPAAHRLPEHDGSCRYLHGHNFYFELTFNGVGLDNNGFIFDFGKMEAIKTFMQAYFDHTLLLNNDDPKREVFKRMEKDGLCKAIFLPCVSSEGLAKFVGDQVHRMIGELSNYKVGVVKVICFEDEKNSATYTY